MTSRIRKNHSTGGTRASHFRIAEYTTNCWIARPATTTAT